MAEVRDSKMDRRKSDGEMVDSAVSETYTTGTDQFEGVPLSVDMLPSVR